MKTQHLLNSIEHLMQLHQPVKISTRQMGFANSGERNFVLEFKYGKSLAMTITCHFGLDYETLKAKVAQKDHTVLNMLSHEDLIFFLTERNVTLFPYLQMYNQKETDYDGLASLYCDFRGHTGLNRFGV